MELKLSTIFFEPAREDGLKQNYIKKEKIIIKEMLILSYSNWSWNRWHQFPIVSWQEMVENWQVWILSCAVQNASNKTHPKWNVFIQYPQRKMYQHLAQIKLQVNNNIYRFHQMDNSWHCQHHHLHWQSSSWPVPADQWPFCSRWIPDGLSLCRLPPGCRGCSGPEWPWPLTELPARRTLKTSDYNSAEALVLDAFW